MRSPFFTWDAEVMTFPPAVLVMLKPRARVASGFNAERVAETLPIRPRSLSRPRSAIECKRERSESIPCLAAATRCPGWDAAIRALALERREARRSLLRARLPARDSSILSAVCLASSIIREGSRNNGEENARSVRAVWRSSKARASRPIRADRAPQRSSNSAPSAARISAAALGVGAR